MSFPHHSCCLGQVPMYEYIPCININQPIGFKEMGLALIEVAKTTQKALKFINTYF